MRVTCFPKASFTHSRIFFPSFLSADMLVYPVKIRQCGGYRQRPPIALNLASFYTLCNSELGTWPTHRACLRGWRSQWLQQIWGDPEPIESLIQLRFGKSAPNCRFVDWLWRSHDTYTSEGPWLAVATMWIRLPSTGCRPWSWHTG